MSTSFTFIDNICVIVKDVVYIEKNIDLLVNIDNHTANKKKKNRRYLTVIINVNFHTNKKKEHFCDFDLRVGMSTYFEF